MRIFLVLMMALFSFACASKPSLPSSNKNALNPTSAAGFFEEDTTLSPAVSAETEVRPGFLIQLSSPLDTKLNGAFRVPMDGNLRLPYGVSVSAAGSTLQNLNMRISDLLQKFYKKSPQVKATISERKYYIEVRGLVQKPGILLVSEREKIEDIMKKSGEIDLAGDARQVQVIRGQNTFYVSLQEYFQGAGMNLSPRWYGGEKVLFMKSSTALGGEATGVIQLLGDIRNPGALSFKYMKYRIIKIKCVSPK